MMKKIIAISAESEQLNNNKIFDYEVARHYPGALWPYYLKTNLGEQYQVVSADVALKFVRDGKWLVDDILVIQHVHDPTAASLVDLGCFPFLVLCFESPLYVGKFYDQVEKIVNKFKYQYLPNGLMKENPNTKKLSSQMYFPSYEKVKKFLEIKNWRRRKFVVLVASNKYVLPSYPSKWTSFNDFLWWAKYRSLELISGHRHESKKYQLSQYELLSFRLELIYSLMSEGKLNIFGRGWGVLKNLPPIWQHKLYPFLSPRTILPCMDKLTEISAYKFSLCIENAKFPGYVTEKIVDCIVAGVVPLYLGAPDIDEIIPKDCFIDVRKFKSFSELIKYLNEFDEEAALEMLFKGRNFLSCDEARLYSYEGFSKAIEQIIYNEMINDNA